MQRNADDMGYPSPVTPKPKTRQVVHKKVVQPGELIQFPIGAEVLTAHEQRGQFCIWYKCDPYNAGQSDPSREYAIYGTGHHMLEAEHRYISSVFLENGDLVLHLFEIMR